MSAPVDQDLRAAATGELQRSFAVRAGAGSGKTAVLTARVLELLRSGVAPGRMAAITFTEKAAGELQRRVREGLERARLEAPSPALDAALANLHELALSTVHSFCRRLLGEEPLASRWAPGTQVGNQDMPGLGAAITAWRAAVRERDPHAAALLGDVSDYQARGALQALVAHRELDPVGDRGGLRAGMDWAALAAAIAATHAAIEDLAAQCSDPACKALAKSEPVRALFAECTTLEPQAAVGALLRFGDVAVKLGNAGRKGDWANGALGEYRALFVTGVPEVQARARGGLHGLALSTLKEIALPVALEAARSEALAGFDDLLFRAAQMLRDDATRARVAGRFDALLIDEVQDTDPMQAEIAALLAREPAATGSWTAHGPRPGGLFAVGDPKQSIYRFRRADVTVWDDLQRVVESTSPASSVELVQNFRSVPGLVAWFNHTFAALPHYTPQVAWRDAGPLDPVVVLQTEEPSGEGDSPDTLHSVSYLHGLMERGAQVVDHESGQLRALRWSDVMVLVPSWGRAHEVADALLRLGAPAVVGGGYTFFQSDEVRLALSGLRALDEPADSEAVVHALRGLFGFTLDELAAHLQGGGSWRYTLEEQAADGKSPGEVADALGVLRRLRREAHESGSWVPRLDRLLDESRALHVWSLLIDGPARLANLDKLRAMIREVEAETRSPSAVLTRLGELAKQNDEAEQGRMDEADDAVLITSIFKAKGLEAPVVLLFGMKRNKPSPSVIPDRTTGRVHVRLTKDIAPGDWDAVYGAEQAAYEEERARWMYVAATRARDQLVVVQQPKANLLEHLSAGLPQPAAEGNSGPATVDLAPGVTVRVVQGAALPPAPLQTETFAGLDERIDALLQAPPGKGDPAAAVREAETIATARVAQRSCARWKSVGEVATGRRGFGLDDTPGVGVGRAGGTLVHRALELLDLNLERAALQAAAPELVRTLGAESGLSDELAERCTLALHRILEHPVMDRIRAASEHWKETPFAFQKPGRAGPTVISGVIDLCFPIDDARTQWVVVDWKSDTPPAGSALRTRYEKQLALYAQALLQTVATCDQLPETILVGPHDELPHDPAQDALELVDPEFARELRRLLDAGAPAPVIGLEVLDGEAQLECAWVEPKVALALDVGDDAASRLANEGWQLVRARSGDPRWAREAGEALAKTW